MPTKNIIRLPKRVVSKLTSNLQCCDDDLDTKKPIRECYVKKERIKSLAQWQIN